MSVFDVLAPISLKQQLN